MIRCALSSVWLHYARFLRMDERLEADDLAVDDKDDTGKDSEPKGKKLKLQLSIHYTT